MAQLFLKNSKNRFSGWLKAAAHLGILLKRHLMRRRNTVILIFAFISALAGCATPGGVMQSWMGHHESELMSKWGAPDSVFELKDGSKVYTWKRVWTDQYGVHQGRQSFTVDRDGIVKYWSYENMPVLLLK